MTVSFQKPRRARFFLLPFYGDRGNFITDQRNSMKLYIPLYLDGTAPWQVRVNLISQAVMLEALLRDFGFEFLRPKNSAEEVDGSGLAATPSKFPVEIDECVQAADLLIGLGDSPGLGFSEQVIACMRTLGKHGLLCISSDCDLSTSEVRKQGAESEVCTLIRFRSLFELARDIDSACSGNLQAERAIA